MIKELVNLYYEFLEQVHKDWVEHKKGLANETPLESLDSQRAYFNCFARFDSFIKWLKENKYN